LRIGQPLDPALTGGAEHLPQGWGSMERICLRTVLDAL
jgi:hypothetical protein